jgi:hypothetical protein
MALSKRNIQLRRYAQLWDELTARPIAEARTKDAEKPKLVYSYCPKCQRLTGTRHIWEQDTLCDECYELEELFKTPQNNPSFFQERSKEECQNRQETGNPPTPQKGGELTRREISFRGNFDRISESLHPTLGTRTDAKAKRLSSRHKNRHKTDENTITTNQSETPKAKPITVPCKTLHPKHKKAHNPITQVYLKLETILISRKYNLSKQTQRQLNQIYLNGDDNHE